MKKISFFLLFLALLFSYACEKEDVSSLDQHEFDASPPEGMMILGEKIKNPYSVENMKKAFDNLRTNNEFKSLSQEDITITTSHLYLRILPKNEEEVNWFIEDTTMEMFDYPLDYEIIKEGYFYQDPDIPFGNPTWLYTTVPVDFKLPDMKIEILDECYIPDYDNVTLKSASKITWLKELENEAFRITGNADDEKKSSQDLMASEVPSGRFQVKNTSNGAHEGLRRVKVRVHRVVKWDTDYTDDDGYYQMSKSFKNDPHYAIIFENQSGFKIWGNFAMFAPANHNLGYRPNTGYSTVIWESSQAWLWATVNNATDIYRGTFCPEVGINPPPGNIRIWTMRQAGDWAGSAPMARQITLGIDDLMDFLSTALVSVRTLGITTALSLCMPDIFILPNYTNTNSCYSTVWHELAHASHYTKAGKTYWSNYITAVIANNGYGDGTGALDGYIGVGEMWGNYGSALCFREHLNYTTPFSSDWWWFVEEEKWFNPGFLKHVNGISDVETYEIFNCLTSTTNTISKLKTNLKSKTGYDTQVDDAYDLYTDWP